MFDLAFSFFCRCLPVWTQAQRAPHGLRAGHARRTRVVLGAIGPLALLAACASSGPGAPVVDRSLQRPVPAAANSSGASGAAGARAPAAASAAAAPAAPAQSTAQGQAANAAPVQSAPAASGAAGTIPPQVLPVGPDGRPLYHVVRRGDTLQGIALEYGQDYRDLARWNSLENPNLIFLDQNLRIAHPDIPGRLPGALPPEGAAQTAPVAVARVEQRPLAAAPAASAASAASPASAAGRVPLKGGPPGEKRPYSERALADLSRPDAGSELAAAQGATPSSAQNSTQNSTQSAAAAASANAAAASPAGAAAAPATALGDGQALGWIWPVASGRPLEAFVDGKTKGIDIPGRAGDPVLAAADGVVIYADSGLRGYGNMVIIKHNNDYLSAYAHNRQLLVKEQQAIRKGQKIAEMGNSDADRVKLHFEIRRQGRPVDPLRFLPERK